MTWVIEGRVGVHQDGKPYMKGHLKMGDRVVMAATFDDEVERWRAVAQTLEGLLRAAVSRDPANWPQPLCDLSADRRAVLTAVLNPGPDHPTLSSAERSLLSGIFGMVDGINDTLGIDPKGS